MHVKHETSDENPEATAVQVVAVWNSWVQVRFPDSGETTWVNLAETPFEETAAPADARR